MQSIIDYWKAKMRFTLLIANMHVSVVCKPDAISSKWNLNAAVPMVTTAKCFSACNLTVN